MTILQPEEYDESYFDGSQTTYRHNAGYSSYKRWKRFDGENSLGEKWKDLAASFFSKHNLQNKKVLEIGCAKGFLVKDLRGMGVDAYGLDVSQYAIDNCEDGVGQYLTVGDARTYLSSYKRNEFDAVFSLRFLECISESDLPDLISEMNRISKYQFHEIDIEPNSDYYLVKSLSWWGDLDWDKGTILVARESGEILTK
jgi:cyclopropane fatty-acyl-phospholipid synthase-like methyltransferase